MTDEVRATEPPVWPPEPPAWLRDRLTAEQWKVLLDPVHPDRVNKLDGNDYLEQWDIRRWLIRVFGPGGWDLENRELSCIREYGHQLPAEQGKAPKVRWWVTYRAQVRLTVRDQWGRTLGFYDGSAADEKANQSAHGDAHHGALTSAESTALKRAAINLGDAFGLALYSKAAFDKSEGKSVPVVGWVAVRPPDAKAKQSAAEAVPAPDPTPAASPPAPQQARPPVDNRTAEQVEVDETRSAVRQFVIDRRWNGAKVERAFRRTYGLPSTSLDVTAEQLTSFLRDLQLEAQEEDEKAKKSGEQKAGAA